MAGATGLRFNFNRGPPSNHESSIPLESPLFARIGLGTMTNDDYGDAQVSYL
jgi:hypothetical protein